MNLLTLAAAAVLFSAATDDRAHVSAAIHYTTVDRSGNVLTLTLTSGHPYYGRERFFYRDRYYYLHYRPEYRYAPPRDVFIVREPVIVIQDDWKTEREYWKGMAKLEKERGKRLKDARKQDHGPGKGGPKHKVGKGKGH
jgi:hypothetical protein